MQEGWDAPQALKTELLDYVRRAQSWDELRDGLMEGYKFYLDYEMNMKPSGRPLPEMEDVLSILMENGEFLQQTFNNVLKGLWSEWREAPANVDPVELAMAIGKNFLKEGPDAMWAALKDFGLVEGKPQSDEEYKRLMETYGKPLLGAYFQAIMEAIKSSGKYDEQEAKAVGVYLEMSLRMIDQEEAARRIRELGFMFGDDYKDDGKGGMPDLAPYLPRLQQAFVEYVRQMLGREFSFL